MTDEIVLDFRNVSKKFSRSLKRSLFYGLKDLCGEILFLDKQRGELRDQEFWALNNITFDLKKGESIGIIGHNGAGKTTTLKLINGLIKPNTGSITVKGRISALIALGAGFNPILTGRENIRVSGAMLGYTREEIRRKEQEIIDFSEVGEFIDSPVQTYSSGMMARLGFSVAIHTEPDILLVDEVLAVGDLNFVIKCFRKIFDFQKNGGAMLLVSHNIYNIRANCSRALWIEKGQLQMFGPVSEVCDAYETFVAKQNADSYEGELYRHEQVMVSNLSFPVTFKTGEDLVVDFVLQTGIKIKKPIFTISIFTLTGVNVVSSSSDMESLDPGSYKLSLTFPGLGISNGTYSLNLVVADTVVNNQLYASTNQNKFSVSGDFSQYGSGLLNCPSVWTQNPL